MPSFSPAFPLATAEAAAEAVLPATAALVVVFPPVLPCPEAPPLAAVVEGVVVPPVPEDEGGVAPWSTYIFPLVPLAST